MKRAKLTVNEAMAEMRERGLSIGPKTFYQGMENGLFPFVRVMGIGNTGRRNLLILRKDFEKWCDENLVEV